jgi:hypothetical protein
VHTKRVAIEATESLERPAQHRLSRRWCLPPAVLRDPSDLLEGDRILAESPNDFGLLLWQTVRDVTLWAGTPPEARGQLFGQGSADTRLALLVAAEVPPQAPTAAIDTLHALLTLSRPDSDLLSLCCLEVAAWARGADRHHTAVAFAQAGALASPLFAEAALQTGLLARAAGQVSRAETWLRRSVGLARRSRDRVSYTTALVELGAVAEAQGAAERAERYYRKGYKAGLRYGARAARMRAAHGLFRLARERNDHATAAQFALSAQSLYEQDAPGGVALLIDLFRFWKNLGELRRARLVLKRLRPLWAALSPAVQLEAASVAARMAAVPGIRDSGRAARELAWALMHADGIPEEVLCEAALNLLHAARTSGDRQGFARAKRAVLRYAPHSEYRAVAALVQEMWPPEEPASVLERAS